VLQDRLTQSRVFTARGSAQAG